MNGDGGNDLTGLYRRKTARYRCCGWQEPTSAVSGRVFRGPCQRPCAMSIPETKELTTRPSYRQKNPTKAKIPPRVAQPKTPICVGPMGVLSCGTSVISAGLDHWYEREDG